MRKIIVFLILIVVLALIWLGLFSSLLSKLGKETLQPPPTFYIPHLDGDKVFKLINDYRVSLEMKSFIKSDELCRIAKERSDELASKTLLGSIDNHIGFETRYSSYPYRIGENLSLDNSEQDTFQGWLNSPPHRKAIEGSWIYSCISCTNRVCVEIFSSFTR